MNKRKFNVNTGITLVALVISVVVLLVIASVTIGAVKENKIIGHSQTAVKNFSELQFEEQLEVIFLSYVTANQRGISINNKKITNKILNIFDYPNIDTETGELDEEEGTTEFYTMTAEEGHVNVTNNSNSETILDVTYDKDNNPKFTIMYKDLVYEYDNYKLAKVDYYVNGNPADWVLDEELLKDGIVKIIGYVGEGEADPNNPGVYNLTIPNRINGMPVSAVDMTSAENFIRINGTLTFSYGLNNPIIRGTYNTNIKKVVLKDNVIQPMLEGSEGVTDLHISSGCKIGGYCLGNKKNLVNVIIEDKVTFEPIEADKPNDYRMFQNCPNLSEESVTEILQKANNYPAEMFFRINFPEDFKINIPKNVEITAYHLFEFATNSIIGEININDNSKVIGSTRLFNTQAGVTIKNLNIGKNCEVQRLFDGITASNKPTINNLSIGENTILKANNHVFYPAVIKNITVADNVTLEKFSFHTCTGIEKITFGKNVSILTNAFTSCSFADGAVVEMYLTDEQKADNSKIPTLWFESTGAFTKTIGADKVTWTKN